MKNKYTKEDAYTNLENINNWINNSDTKASIILALIGVILSILLTNDMLLNKYVDLFKVVIKDINFSDFLYIIFVLISLILLFLGLYRLIKVLIPTLKAKIDSNKPSHTYFGSISNFSSSIEFKESLKKTTEEELMDDILNQVYINSVICNNKFNNFKNGLKYSFVGLVSVIILFIIGILIYL